jgi:replication-associated recombination protein RarA
MTTPHGHFCGEVTSAMQKSIRRGEERDALYFAAELELAGYGNYVWKRLRIIASEDVGLADPMACVVVRTLFENWVEQRKADKSVPSGEQRLFIVHAVLYLARARKSRLVDHALMAMWEGDRQSREIPDYALDRHTAAGKRLGRGWPHFFDVGAHLENRGDVPDPFEEEGRAVRENGNRRRLKT